MSAKRGKRLKDNKERRYISKRKDLDLENMAVRVIFQISNSINRLCECTILFSLLNALATQRSRFRSLVNDSRYVDGWTSD